MYDHSGDQFGYPSPKGSELIVATPFRDGVFSDNQFADWIINRNSFCYQKDLKLPKLKCHSNVKTSQNILIGIVQFNVGSESVTSVGC